jgi:predicted HicB family RNase H-like nuclease
VISISRSSEWSEKDGCYIGTAPGLILGGIHGKDEWKVFKELCQAVEEAIQIFEKEGHPLPAPTANKKYSGKILLRIPPDLHKALAIKALKEGQSVNKVIQHRIEKSF